MTQNSVHDATSTIYHLPFPPQHTMKGTISSICVRHWTHFFIIELQAENDHTVCFKWTVTKRIFIKRVKECLQQNKLMNDINDMTQRNNRNSCSCNMYIVKSHKWRIWNTSFLMRESDLVWTVFFNYKDCTATWIYNSNDFY